MGSIPDTALISFAKAAFVLVIALCLRGDHMVGILPRGWRWYTLRVNAFDDRVFRIKRYLNPDDYYFITFTITPIYNALISSMIDFLKEYVST